MAAPRRCEGRPSASPVCQPVAETVDSGIEVNWVCNRDGEAGALKA